MTQTQEKPVKDETVVIVRMWGAFGRAYDLDTAMENCLNETGLPDRLDIAMDARRGVNLEIDDMGAIHHKGELETIPEDEVRGVFAGCIRMRFENALDDVKAIARLYCEGDKVDPLEARITRIMDEHMGW